MLRDNAGPTTFREGRLRSEEVRTEFTSFLEANGLIKRDDAQVLWLRRQRHDTALVTDGKQSWFIKRRGSQLVSGDLSLKAETLVYRPVAQGSLPIELGTYLPRLLIAGNGGDLLVFEGLLGHHDLRNAFHQNRDGQVIISASEQIGNALALLHSGKSADAQFDFPGIENPTQTFGNLEPEVIGHAPGAYIELVRLLQANPILNLRLRELRDSWTGTTLIHGDMKVDNIMVSISDEPDAKPLITDWETAGIGDAGWDCGSYIGSLCYLGLEALAARTSRETQQSAFKQILSATQTFWRAYESGRVHDFDFDKTAEGTRAFQWAGYWLIQRVAMMLPLRQSLSAADISALYLGSQLVLDGKT